MTVPQLVPQVEGDPSRSSTFQLVAGGLVTAVTVAGLLVMLIAGMPLDLFFIAVAGLAVPIAIYYFGVKNSRSVVVCGIILLTTMIPAWAVFLLFPDYPYRFIYVLPAALVSFVACLVGWLKQTS